MDIGNDLEAALTRHCILNTLLIAWLDTVCGLGGVRIHPRVGHPPSPQRCRTQPPASRLWAAGGPQGCLLKKSGHVVHFLGLACGRSQIWTCSNLDMGSSRMVLPPLSRLLAAWTPYGHREMSDDLLIAFLPGLTDMLVYL